MNDDLGREKRERAHLGGDRFHFALAAADRPRLAGRALAERADDRARGRVHEELLLAVQKEEPVRLARRRRARGPLELARNHIGTRRRWPISSRPIERLFMLASSCAVMR